MTPHLSVVVPCYNEAAALGYCHERLTKVLSGMSVSYEIVYIDDGSKDATPEMLRALHEQDPHITVLLLSRNFGHQLAVTAGMGSARGQAIVIIDSDLQDPPELIPEMLALWERGYQVVYGVRASRAGESGFKLLTAKLFYRLINTLSDVSIPLDTGDFRLIDRKVLDALNHMPERHRLLRGMSSWVGFRQIGLSYHRSERIAGETKYPLKKMLGLALDGIVSFSVIPLRLVTGIGLTAALVAFLGIVYTLGVRLFTQSWVRGWAMSFIGMLFMSGLQLLCLGILGEYVGRTYTESKGRPLYLLDEVLPAGKTSDDAGSRAPVSELEEARVI